jgi:hypothetical protein
VAEHPRVFRHAGFFFSGGAGWPQPPGANPMNQLNPFDPTVVREIVPPVGQQICPASAVKQRLTGRASKAVAVALNGETPVIARRAAARDQAALFAHRPLIADANPTGWADPEESLVADRRGSLTPAQMVDEKLLALLGSCPRSRQPVSWQPRRWAQESARSVGSLPTG